MKVPAVMRYADDLVGRHADRAVLEKCQGIISAQRTGRGLALTPRKTRITHTLRQEEGATGFDFLGFTIRQYPVSKTKRGFKSIITPSKKAMQRPGRRRGEVITHQKMANQAPLIMERGPVIGGWRHSYARVGSKRTDSTVDRTLLNPLRAWVQGRHPKKSRQWATAQSWQRAGNKRHCSPKNSRIRLHVHSETPRKRHGKIQGNRSP